MHEWALAESILVASVDAAEKENLKRITLINVKLGELQQINKKIFEQALEDIIESLGSEILKKSKINVETEKSALKCNKCDFEWKFSDVKNKLSDDESESIHFIPEIAFVHSRCPKCGSPDFDIIKGRGVSITSINGEK